MVVRTVVMEFGPELRTPNRERKYASGHVFFSAELDHVVVFGYPFASDEIVLVCLSADGYELVVADFGYELHQRQPKAQLTTDVDRFKATARAFVLEPLVLAPRQ